MPCFGGVRVGGWGLFENWGRQVSTGQGKCDVARRGERSAYQAFTIYNCQTAVCTRGLKPRDPSATPDSGRVNDIGLAEALRLWARP